jgi:hypothetical protein
MLKVLPIVIGGGNVFFVTQPGQHLLHILHVLVKFDGFLQL